MGKKAKKLKTAVSKAISGTRKGLKVARKKYREAKPYLKKAGRGASKTWVGLQKAKVAYERSARRGTVKKIKDYGEQLSVADMLFGTQPSKKKKKRR